MFVIPDGTERINAGTGGLQKLYFKRTINNIGNMWDDVNSRITIPYTGVYSFNINVHYTNSSINTMCSLGIIKSSDNFATIQPISIQQMIYSTSINTFYYLLQGNQVEFYGYTDGSGQVGLANLFSYANCRYMG